MFIVRPPWCDSLCAGSIGIGIDIDKDGFYDTYGDGMWWGTDNDENDMGATGHGDGHLCYFYNDLNVDSDVYNPSSLV